MRTKLVTKALAATLLFGALGASQTANALFLGTSVTGSLTLGGGSTNVWDSNNGFVPSGFGNTGAGGAAVVIVDPQFEFGFNDGLVREFANFTDDELIIQDTALSADTHPTQHLIFVNSAFNGLTLTELTDSYLNGGATATLVGDTLTVDIASYTGATVHHVFYGFTPAPEPFTMSLGFAGIGLFVRRRAKVKRG